MSWLSAGLNKSKLGRTLNQLAKPVQKIVNPILDEIPGVGTVKRGVELVADYVPGAERGADLVAGKTGGAPAGLSAADWLKAISGGLMGGLDYKQNQANTEESNNRYARTTGNAEAATAVGAQDRLNRAPMADNAQALLMARMKAAPTTFAPRDFTKGPMTAATMAAPATGGPADQMAAGRTAAAGYTPGSGGVDTSVLEMLKRKMLASSGMRA